MSYRVDVDIEPYNPRHLNITTTPADIRVENSSLVHVKVPCWYRYFDPDEIMGINFSEEGFNTVLTDIESKTGLPTGSVVSLAGSFDSEESNVINLAINIDLGDEMTKPEKFKFAVCVSAPAWTHLGVTYPARKDLVMKGFIIVLPNLATA